MKHDPNEHHPRSIRLRDYDYAQAGAYFVTICAQNRMPMFGEILDGEMLLNDYGRVVQVEWSRTSSIRAEVELDAFVVMPNHFHGIVFIKDDTRPDTNVGATGRSPLRSNDMPRGPAKRSLGAMIAGYKSIVTKRINISRNTPGAPVWQRNYYEHIIRNEDDLHDIREYIVNSPAKWAEDRYNPNNTEQIAVKT